MNTSTAVQTTSHDTTPAEVAPGIFRVTVPVPFRSLKAVNLWLLDDGDGFTMIDCGFNDDDTMARLENAWDAVLGGKPVGVDTLAAVLSEERDTIEEVIEPFLIQQGFVVRTPRGRALCPPAFGYLGLSAPSSDSDTGLLFDDTEV